MYGLLQALFYIVQRKKSIEKMMSESTTKNFNSLEQTLFIVNATIDFLNLQLNEFLLYVKATDGKAYKIIKKRFFEAKSWSEATFDYYDADEDAFRMHIKRLCEKYDAMPEIQKEEYVR